MTAGDRRRLSDSRGVRVTAYEIILRKRDGDELSSDEIRFMVEGFLAGDVADYQMSAFLMAVFFVGMTDAETETLTRVMLGSGATLDLSRVEGAKVDKHSTGGVGDKLSLVIAPVAAAAGVRVPMISGRGLGHTGGTLDKLESIPGLKTDFASGDVARLVDEVGMAIVGQSPEVAPADRRMYALRDVTATIECVPLIVGSILSKKLAAGLDALVLDVKVGRGAFMGTLETARRLAQALIATADRLGLPAVALLTDMESPLGRTVGNALEVVEAIDVLSGGGPPDVRETSLAIAARMIHLAGLEPVPAAALVRAEAVLTDGSALGVFERFVAAQGGDAAAVRDPSRLPRAANTREVVSPRPGHVVAIDALEIGLASLGLGAGRTTVDDPIDPAVGLEIVAPVGAAVSAGDPLAVVHWNDPTGIAAAVDRVGAAFALGDERPEPRSRLIEVLECEHRAP